MESSPAATLPAGDPPPSIPVAKASAERDKRRLVLRAANLRVWQDGPRSPASALDSNMKKNTGFIKKIRQGLGSETKEQLIKEAAVLNLDKYVEELTHAVPEGLAKCITPKDCTAAAEVLTELHSRFAPELFAYPLAAALDTALAPPDRSTLQGLPAEQRDREETSRVGRQKVLARISAELALVELLRAQPPSKPSEAAKQQFAGQEWLYGILKDLLSTDREHSNVPILIGVLKAFGSHMLKVPAEHEEAKLPAEPESETLVDLPMRAKYRKLCETYFATLAKRITREYERLQEQDRRNHEAYIKSGEIFEDRQQNYEKMTRNFEKAFESGKGLSELLGLPLPTLTDTAKTASSGLAINLDSRSSLKGDRSDEMFISGTSPWEDEDTRRFYEDILDLKDMIPPSILGLMEGSEGASGPDHDNSGDGVAVPPPGASSASAGAEKSKKTSAATSPVLGSDKDLAGEDGLQSGPAAQLTALLARLPEYTNRALIDTAAVDFALINSKGSRRRLVKHLVAIPRSRSDLIPYYARLVATLNAYMSDVGKGVIEALDDEFRYLHRKRTADLSESRAKNARFIGELTKFGVTPLHTIFHCFKICLDEFSGPSIEVLAALLETCGRWLLRTEATAERMRSLLEMLRRKRAVKNLDQRQVLWLDNAYYQCNPPERRNVEAKQRSPMELYIRYLVYHQLNRGTTAKVVKLLRKLHWSDPGTLTVLFEVFTRPWRIRFSNVYLLAVLLADLQPYHPAFVVAVIDHVCEEVRLGMELNVFKLNQRRLATVEYIGELYNYRLINSDIVFDQLWSFATFGHVNGQPLPSQVSTMDAPDDFFRLRLICTLLDNCGVCFDKGSLRQRLDEFLAFLNLYVLSKEQPLPMDVDFMLSDTLEALRPNMVFTKDWAEAARAVDSIRAAHSARVSAQQSRDAEASGQVQHAAEGSDSEDDDESDDGDDSGSDSDDDSDVEHDEDGGDGDDDNDDGAEKSGGQKKTRKRVRRRHGADRDEELTAGQSRGGEEAPDSTDEEADSDSEEESRSEDDDEDDVSHSRTHQSQAEQEAEEDFARELAKMMAESHSSTGGSGPSGSLGSKSHSAQPRSNHLFEQGLPFIKRSVPSAATQSGEEAGATAQSDSQPVMRFELLSKRGNKLQTSTLHLPAESRIAVSTREKQLREIQERKQLKEYVLGYEGREDEEERLALEKSLGRRGARPMGRQEFWQPR